MNESMEVIEMERVRKHQTLVKPQTLRPRDVPGWGLGFRV